jgi:hypothetical protein
MCLVFSIVNVLFMFGKVWWCVFFYTVVKKDIRRWRFSEFIKNLTCRRIRKGLEAKGRLRRYWFGLPFSLRDNEP